MKQNDIAVIIIVVFIAGVLSFFVSNALFGSADSRKTEVEVVSAISPEFTTPDQRYFNGNSLNPTQLIQIGDQANQQPF